MDGFTWRLNDGDNTMEIGQIVGKKIWTTKILIWQKNKIVKIIQDILN